MRAITGLVIGAAAYFAVAGFLKTDTSLMASRARPNVMDLKAAPFHMPGTTTSAEPCPATGRAFSVSPASMHSLQDISSGVAAARKLALTDFNAALHKANSGDGVAALAALSLIRSCRSIAKNFEIWGIADDHFNQDPANCANVPKQVLDDPLAILLPAAHAGSNEAKLIFAMNAQAMAGFLRLDPNVQPARIAQLTERAMQFAEEAADSGLEEAFTFLASAHYRGAAHQKEPVLAYAYASFISGAKHSSFPTETVDHIYRAITREQVQQARKLISSCSAPRAETASVLLNPF